MSKAFFLTRQTANLMEDFVRELETSPSLFLLYGDARVGKTRTLEELVRTRLGDFKVHWIDLKAGGAGDGALVDSSDMIESVFDKANTGDIIIADHFEMALKKTRHQLFLSWSTDGVDKKLNLIIAGNSDYFNELRQLAQQYQVRVQSFQQMPFNPDETTAFLGFYLFPDRPIGNLSIPPLLRNQLTMAHGNVGKIIEIAERAGDQITTAPMDDTESIRQGSRIIVGVLITVALVIGVGWYLWSSQRHADDLQLAQDAAPAPGPARSEAAPLPQAGTSAEVAAAADAGAAVGAEMQPVSVTPIAETGAAVEQEGGVIEAAQGEGAAAAPETDSVALLETSPATKTAAEPEPGPAAEPEPVSEPVAEPEAEPVSEPIAEPEAESAPAREAEQSAMVAAAAAPEPAGAQGRLQRDLQASLEWINNSDSKVGTLQIMLLSLDRFNKNAYYEYLAVLAEKDVDISAIRIFRTWTGGREVYSVVYGEYDSWSAAGAAKDAIPPVLQKASPIPRSVGGLMEEIRRLDAGN